MNRMTPETLEGLRKPGGKKAKTAPRPEKTRDEAEPRVYTTKDGHPYIPSENLFSCLVKAGQSVRLDGKRQMSTASSTTLPAYMVLLDPYIPLVDPTTEKPPAWEVDVRQGKNPNGGEAVCIVRPRFDVWAFDVTIEVFEEEIAESVIRDLFDKAGGRIGLGDFRPQRKGPFGRFRVDRWQRTEAAQAVE